MAFSPCEILAHVYFVWFYLYVCSQWIFSQKAFFGPVCWLEKKLINICSRDENRRPPARIGIKIETDTDRHSYRFMYTKRYTNIGWIFKSRNAFLYGCIVNFEYLNRLRVSNVKIKRKLYLINAMSSENAKNLF